MTTTVTVKARAWGAVIAIRSVTDASSEVTNITLEPNTEQTYHLEPGQAINVQHGEEPAVDEAASHLPLDPNEVPGRAQNDALLGTASRVAGTPQPGDDAEDLEA